MNHTEAIDDNNGHADNIIGILSYEAPQPQQHYKDEFLAWHKPRKQYVRHYQWSYEIKRLIQRNPPAEGLLKYLGLPGLDLLDLRHFHAAICEEQKVMLRFLGFNTSAKPQNSAQTELNISMDEVKHLLHVDSRSEVIGDNFSMLSNQNSLAFQKASEFGPYDVVNLDLCDGFGSHEPGALENTYYDAVNSLLALQSRSPNPWLLFLTTRTDKANINSTLLARLIEKYCSNLESSDAFREASREKFAIETKQAVASATGQSEGLLQVFLTGLCKWFLGLSLQHAPPTLVELRSAFGYRVLRDAQHEDLVSLALKFTPTAIPSNDPLRIATNTSNPPDEGLLATKALQKVASRIDADKKLNDDAALLQKMIDSTADLLSQARYDPIKYRSWAAMP